MQERLRGNGRDSWNGRKCRFGGSRACGMLPASGVDGSRARCAALATRRKQANPERRIGRRGRANQWDPQIGGGKACSADRRSAQRAVVEIHSLDEEIRHPGPSSHDTELPPESSGDEVEMQPPDSLPFDYSAAAHRVVVCAEPSKLDIHALLGKERRNPTSAFTQVDDDSHLARSVSRCRWTNCAETVDTHPLLALSRSESA